MARTPDRTSGRAEKIDLATPKPSSEGVRWAEILIGLVVVGAFVAAGVFLFETATATTPVLVVADEGINRGDVISVDDLQIADISSEDPMAFMGFQEAPSILGQVAVTDIRGGTLVTPDLFSDGADIGDGQGVLGLSLVPGEYPSASLAIGDRVRIVQTPRIDDEQPASVLVESAEIVEVNRNINDASIFIGVLMQLGEADAVAVAAALDQVTIIQIPRGGE
ncbi:MAG: SAF domain-containing protein [Actinomycetota bacterium]